MSFEAIKKLMPPAEAATLSKVKEHAERLLNYTPRFKFFTLHGTQHLESLFRILGIFIKGGLKLSPQELFLLSLAICLHDLGMVVTLGDKELPELIEGRPAFPDPASFENYIRDNHHELVDEYCKLHFGFLTDLGLSPTQIGQVVDISRCHRKVVLEEQHGMVRYLGALLRIIDECDISALRAPADVFQNNFDSMDGIACWHWFKHNITEEWVEDHNVSFVEENGRKRIELYLVVRPPKKESISYWLNQVHRPIKKVLYDDQCQLIVKEKFGIEIEVVIDPERSVPAPYNPEWLKMEERALSQNRKVILVADDEFRKLEDMFYPLMDYYHVIPAFHAKDALLKLAAAPVDLVIVDMQIGSGGIWTDVETSDYKLTGINLCNKIAADFPQTKLGILTGTKHQMPSVEHLTLVLNLRKPINPKTLLEKVRNVFT